MSREVHLCGSVPLASVDEVMETVATTLGDLVRRIPDGEVGERGSWIAWQEAVLRGCPQLVAEPKMSSAYGTVRNQFRLAPGVSPDAVELGSLGYARVAEESYARFAALKARDVIAETTRFMVGLPTPLSMALHFGDEADRPALERVLEAAIRAEAAAITAAIPAAELAIQWEVVFEFAVLEGVLPAFFDDPPAAVTERLTRLGGLIAPEVELGYHLCYGDARGRHFREPQDARWLAAVAAGLVTHAVRRIDWIHLPVPVERDDAAYFAPLEKLRLPPETTLYLGLLHREDGLPGALRRMEAAARFTPAFGVGTECGLGREPAAEIPSLLELHVAAAEAP